jgi:hypothetical protein
MALNAVAVRNSDERNQKYAVPNLGCRPGAFALNMAMRPVAALATPSST